MRPSGIQRRAPFTPLPMNGISTSTSSTSEPTNTQGASFSHTSIGTCTTTSAANRATPIENAWRARKWVCS